MQAGAVRRLVIIFLCSFMTGLIASYFDVVNQVLLVLVVASFTYLAWRLISNITPLGNYLRQQGAKIIRSNFEPIHMYAGQMVYLLCALGLQIFVLPIVHNIGDALLYGFLFALVVEGVFGFANYASTNHYSAQLLWVNMIVGCIIISSMSVLMFLLRLC